VLSLSEESEVALKIKGFYLMMGFNSLIRGVVEKENPNLDPFWALDEIAIKLRDLAKSFK